MQDMSRLEFFCFRHPTKRVEAVCMEPTCNQYRFFCIKCFLEKPDHLNRHRQTILDLETIENNINESKKRRNLAKFARKDSKEKSLMSNSVLNIQAKEPLEKHKTIVEKSEIMLKNLIADCKSEMNEILSQIYTKSSEYHKSNLVKFETKYNELLRSNTGNNTNNIVASEWNINWSDQVSVESLFDNIISKNYNTDFTENFSKSENLSSNQHFEKLLMSHWEFINSHSNMSNENNLKKSLNELMNIFKRRVKEISSSFTGVSSTRTFDDLYDQEDTLGFDDDDVKKKIKPIPLSQESEVIVESSGNDDSAPPTFYHKQTLSVVQNFINKDSSQESPYIETQCIDSKKKNRDMDVSDFTAKIFKDESQAEDLTTSDFYVSNFGYKKNDSKKFEIRRNEDSKKRISTQTINNYFKPTLKSQLEYDKDKSNESLIVIESDTPIKNMFNFKQKPNDSAIIPEKVEKQDKFEKKQEKGFFDRGNKEKEKPILNIQINKPEKPKAPETQEILEPTLESSPRKAQENCPFILDVIKSNHTEGITCLAIVKDYIATGSLDSTISIWDVHTFRLIRKLKGHKFWVTCLASTNFDSKSQVSESNDYQNIFFPPISFDAEPLLLSGGLDFEIKVWNPIASEEELFSLNGHYQLITSIKTFKYFPELIVSCSRDKNIKFWDLKEKKCILTKFEHKDWISCLELFHVKNLLVSCSNDKSIIIWKLIFNTANKLQRCVLKHAITKAHEGPIQSLSLVSEERYFLSASNDGFVKLWDPDSGLCVKKFNLAQHLIVKVSTINNLTVDHVKYPPPSFDGNIENKSKSVSEAVVAITLEGTIYLWDLNTQEELIHFESNNSFKETTFPYGDAVTVWNEYNKDMKVEKYNMISVNNADSNIYLWKF